MLCKQTNKTTYNYKRSGYYCVLLNSVDFRFGLVWYMVFNATFNNISVISWRSVLLVEETGEP